MRRRLLPAARQLLQHASWCGAPAPAARGPLLPGQWGAGSGCSSWHDQLPSSAAATRRVSSAGAAPGGASAAAAAHAVGAAPFALGAEHARRLKELLDASHLHPQQHQQQQQQQPQHAGAAASATAAAELLHAQQTQQTHPPHRRRRRLDLGSIPMLGTPAGKQHQQRRGGGGGGGCGGAASSSAGLAAAAPQPLRREEGEGDQSERAPHPPPSVDWHEVVESARRLQERVGGERMLTDTFGRKHTYLRISLTERCNLRCSYCMPADGVELTAGAELLSADEVLRLASLFVSAGVDKIRLTGGEPTVRADLADICRRLSALPGLRTLAMTSNGVALKRQLPTLKAAGLNALNISLDTLRPERFEALTRRQGHGRAVAAIEEALRLGYDPVKVNVVVMRGVNDDEVADFVELTRDAPVNVRFIEYMPFDGNVWSDSKMVPYRELMARIQDRFPAGLVRHADPAGEVAKNFSVPGHRGSVSFVTSMTHAFCGDCNRLRLLADGSLKVCLFGPNEVSLRDAMRAGASDEELRLVISAAVDRKRAAHAGMFELAATQNRPMITIGG